MCRGFPCLENDVKWVKGGHNRDWFIYCAQIENSHTAASDQLLLYEVTTDFTKCVAHNMIIGAEKWGNPIYSTKTMPFSLKCCILHKTKVQ